MRNEILKKLLNKVTTEIVRNEKKLPTCKTRKDIKNRKSTLLELEFYQDVIIEGITKDDKGYMELLDLEGMNKAKLSNSNKKTGIASWNTLELITCTYATENCKKECYAKKATVQYKITLFQRVHNTMIALRKDFSELLTTAIKKEKTSQIRLHDAGGFIGQEYLNQILKTIDNCKNVQFITYTKSLQFTTILNTKENCTANFSIFNDTPQEQIEASQDQNIKSFECMDYNEFMKTDKIKCTIYSKVKENKNVNKQKVDTTCQDCGLCLNKTVNAIVVLKH